VNRVIAIDGPSASGKSTVAKGVARAIGAVYVDSGAFYRGVTWQALRDGADPAGAAAVMRSLESAQWQFEVCDGAVRFSINGTVPPDSELRGKAVREAVSEVAAIPEVRCRVVAFLQALRELGSLVMEGRDIGTVVFAETPHKFYLDADPRERAMRRYRELIAAGEDEKAHEVMESLQNRDARDQSRATAPLQAAPDARVIDSTALNVEEVIAVILKAVQSAGQPGKDSQ
jgi:CMP/dCMP kinase